MGSRHPHPNFLPLWLDLADLQDLESQYPRYSAYLSSTATRLDTHLREGLQHHGAVRVEVEDGEALHLLGHTAGLRQVCPGLSGQNGQHRGVVGRVLSLGEREGAGACAVVCLVGDRRDHTPSPPHLLQVDLQGLEAAHRLRSLRQRLAWAQL